MNFQIGGYFYDLSIFIKRREKSYEYYILLMFYYIPPLQTESQLFATVLGRDKLRQKAEKALMMIFPGINFWGVG